MGQQLTSNCYILKQRELQTFEPSAQECLASFHSLCHQKGSLQRDRQPTLLWMLRIKMLGQQDTKAGVFLGNYPLYTACSLSEFAKKKKKNMQMCLETSPGETLHCQESGFTGTNFLNRRAQGHFSPTDRHAFGDYLHKPRGRLF